MIDQLKMDLSNPKKPVVTKKMLLQFVGKNKDFRNYIKGIQLVKDFREKMIKKPVVKGGDYSCHISM
jgi:hypothetical protein